MRLDVHFGMGIHIHMLPAVTYITLLHQYVDAGALADGDG